MLSEDQISKRIDPLTKLLKEKIKVALIDDEITTEDDFNRILVCNNSAWVLGELAQINPEAMKKYAVEIFNSLAEILERDLINFL